MKKTWKMTKMTAVILTAAAIATLSACSQKGAIKSGSWEENTFTNEWSDIKLVMPEGFTAMSDEEIMTLIKNNNETLIEDGMSRSQLDASLLQSVHDFGLNYEDEISSLALMYVNLSYSPATVKYAAEDYYKEVKDGLLAMTGFDYVEIEKTTATIVGEEYIKGRFTVYEGVLMQDYYIRKYDGAIVAFIATYIEETEEVINDLLNSVTKAK